MTDVQEKTNEETTTKSEDNNNENKKDEKEESIGFKIFDRLIGVAEKGIGIFLKHQLNEKKMEKDKEKEKLEKENKETDNDIAEIKEKLKSLEEKDKEKKKLNNEGKQKWIDKKKELIDSMISNIDYLSSIEIISSKMIDDLKKEIDEKISEIFKNNLKETFSLSIKSKHISILKKIKNNIPLIETLNFMIAGMTGAGKSTLTNALLKDNVSEESRGIHPKTQEFAQYSNKNKVPGITIYDTFGVEPTNDERNLLNTKQKIQKTFDENLEDPKKSLHGILYCIKNGNASNRIEKGEINFILELSKIYGNHDILTIVFTQSLHPETEERIKELKKELNNDNIEIIQVLVKDFTYKIGKQEVHIDKFGLDELGGSMKKKSRKIVTANLKRITKLKLKEKYYEDIYENYIEIKKKIKNHEFKRTFAAECEDILEIIFEPLNLNYTDIEKIISDYINKMREEIMETLKKQNKDKSIYKINEEFTNINSEYDNTLTFNLLNEENDFNLKFEEYFEPKINKEVNNIVLEKASSMFLEKSKEFFGEAISENVQDEEIQDVVEKNLDNILQKINSEK